MNGRIKVCFDVDDGLGLSMYWNDGQPDALYVAL